MVFSSLVFLTLFLPATLLIYHFAFNSIKLKNATLIVASLIFYAWSGLYYLVLLLTSAAVNYIFGILIGQKRQGNKAILTVSILFNLLLLCFFKYFGFFAENLNNVLLNNKNFAVPRIPLPVGISFYTFQIISYVVDVYRGRAKEQKNFFYVLLYISLFPQLIAGPIVRYTEIESAIKQRNVKAEDIQYGLKRFIGGLCKKVLISNQVAVLADAAFQDINACTASVAWIGIISYTIQIYFDFSGYSDMAIGMGRIFGFRFPENFDFPYISKSIQEFWRRWHITLSSWFRDYVYIPLGGSRRGSKRTIINLLVVFLLTGLWHGAGWQFITWGIFHGTFLVLERIPLIHRLIERMWGPLRHIYVMVVVMIGWVFFRADSLQDAALFLSKMFCTETAIPYTYTINFTPFNLLSILTGIFFSAPVLQHTGERLKRVGVISGTRSKPIYYVSMCLYVCGLCFCIMSISAGSYNPFIYFTF